MAQTRSDILARVTSLCLAAGFTQAESPFDFVHQPSGSIDGAFRLTAEQQDVIGGTNFSEEQTDLVTIWLARKQADGFTGTYTQLAADVDTMRASVVRDGAQGGGDFAVLDGGSVSLEHESGQEYAVARLALPINYEVQL